MKTMQDIIRELEAANVKKAMPRMMAGGRRSPDQVPFPPQRLYDKYQVSHKLYDHRPAFFLSPGRPALRILYIHGGAFYNSFVSAHWHLMDNMVKKLNAEVISPDYPLTPIFGHWDVFSMVTSLYQDCLLNLPAGGLVLAGDSAGGGIALALTQWALQNGLPLPRRLALLSPWIDVTMSNPATKKLAEQDPFLNPESGLVIGKWYAQGADPKFYQVSPLYGPMAGLPPTLIQTGTRDILNADAHALCRALQANNSPCRLSEGKGMIHTWMLFNIAESKPALEEVFAFIKGGLN